MRSFLAFGLLITLCASASAATIHHSRAHHVVFMSPSAASSFAAVPGWGDTTIRYTPSYNDPSRHGGDEALPAH
jgi:hypothetical protein